jgi:uncharacterized protein
VQKTPLRPSSTKLHGVGLGLRWEFIADVVDRLDSVETLPKVPFFEVPPENYLRRGGYYFDSLLRVNEKFPLLSHGLTLSVGATDAFDGRYMSELRAFLERIAAPWHSDHLCFSGHDGRILHDLLPLPLTHAALNHTARRIAEARDLLGLPLLLENITHYCLPGRSALSEAEFIGELLEKSDAGLLLDVNNVYVNSLNYGFDPRGFLQKLPLTRTRAIHVAGHEWWADDVIDPVLELLEWTIARIGPVPVILERDNQVPSLDILLAEVNRLDAAYQRGIGRYHERA